MIDEPPSPSINVNRLFDEYFARSPRSTQLLAASGETLAVNVAWEALWGARLDDLGDYNIRHDVQLSQTGTAAYLERAFAGDAVEIPPIPYVLDRGPTAGETRWVRATATPILDDFGNVALVVLVHEDVTDTMAANERLSRMQELLEESQLSARVGSWAWDLRTSELTWSAETYRLFELDAEAAVSYERFLERVHPDDRVTLAAQIERALKERGSFEVNHRILLSDGSVRVLNARGRVVLDADGTPLRMVGSGQDVTERLRAEEAVRESEERYRTLFESIDVGFCAIEVLSDANGKPIDYRFLDANPAFRQQSGLPDAVGRRMRELAPEHEAFWFETYGRIATSGQPERFERKARALDGRWFDVFGFPLGRDGSPLVGVLFTDITARKNAEQHTARIAAIVESSRDAFLILDPAGVVTDWNPAAEELYGYRAEEAVGRYVGFLFPPGKKREPGRVFRRLQAGERIPPFETVRVSKDGEPIDVEIALSPVLDAAGRMTGTAVIARDIRERRAGERQQQEFLDAVSHDLKNPLTSVRMQVQLLQRRASRGVLDMDAVTGLLSGIEAATGRMEAQLDELQDVARLRAGYQLELQIEAVNLVALVEEAASETQLSTSDHDVRLDASERELVGQWDRLRLRRVIDNLLNNAVKYSEGGAVTVTVRKEQRGERHWAVLAVRDEGVGIPSSDLSQLFQRFRRGSNVGDRSRGAGIGLAGARQIIDQHEGTIDVESVEGTGSTFTVALPLDFSDARQTAETPDRAK